MWRKIKMNLNAATIFGIILACGTGMPTPRPAKAAACFLMELGNGDKFIFDIGSGSAERVSALTSNWTA
jgi:ribonuclease BN (tRNA processing enzyme)